MDYEERRGSRRFDLSWPISLLTGEDEIARGETSNISEGGAYFMGKANAEVSAGMTVIVKIDVPDKRGRAPSDETISGKALVVRLKAEENGCGIALHFSENLDPFGK